MVYLDKLTIFLFSLSLLTPLYASLLGKLNLNILVTGIYAIGLLTYIIINGKKLRFNFFDLLIILFCFIFIFSVSYTSSDNYMTNFILFFILPLFYFAGKITSIKQNFKYIFLILIIFTSIIDLYVLIKLADNNFIYHTYYYYSNSLLLLDYLTMSQYSLISLIIIFFNKNFNLKIPIIIKSFIIVFLVFMILISGSRFTIGFLLIFLFIYFISQIDKTNLIKLFLAFIVSSFFIMNYFNVNNFFEYTIKRFDSATKEDNSINERKIMIDKALSKINDNLLFGYGISSTEKEIGFKYIHNMFLETLLETGLINFFILCFIIIYIFIVSIKTKNHALTFIYVYLVLSYSKSFTISEAKFLFFIIGILIINQKIKSINVN